MFPNEMPEVLGEEGLDRSVGALIRELALRRVGREHETASDCLHRQLLSVGRILVLPYQSLDIFLGVERGPEDNLELPHHQQLAEESNVPDECHLLQRLVQLDHYIKSKDVSDI